MKKLARLSLFLVIFGLGAGLLADFCQKQTKGFWLQNLLPSLAYEYTPSSQQDENLSSYLNQPFYFLKKGQQCFAFVSQDKKYVLKLFRWDKLEPSRFSQFIPSTRKQKEEKRKLDFASYQLAIDHLKEETGLLFLSTTPGGKIHLPLEIYDNLRIKHTLLTDETAFILQKKAEDFFTYFKQKLAEGKEEELLPFFAKLADLIKKRAEQEIEDSDITIEYNMGILDGNPILFDIGNLKRGNASPLEQGKLVLASLKTYSPELALFFEKSLQHTDR